MRDKQIQIINLIFKARSENKSLKNSKNDNSFFHFTFLKSYKSELVLFLICLTTFQIFIYICFFKQLNFLYSSTINGFSFFNKILKQNFFLFI